MIIDFFKKAKLDESDCSIKSSYGAKQDKHSIIKLPTDNRVFEYQLLRKDKDNINTAYYRNGFLYNVYPRNESLSLDEDRDKAYFARYVVLNGKKYDLCSPKDVIEIKIPNFKKNTGAFSYPTRNLAYIMKIRAQKIYQKELAIPTVFTTVNLMMVSNIGWQAKDYNRLISQLERLEEYKYASILREGINNYTGLLINNSTGYYDHIWNDEETRRYAQRVIEFEWIEDNLPDIAPKSLNGYSRMKHANSKNYVMLKNRAKELGMELNDNL